MHDDRDTMSDPRTALMILLFAALPAGLLTTGCNPNTRELLLDPRLPVAEPYTGGTWTTTPVLTCGRYMNALAAWSRDDILVVGGDRGLAVRMQGGVARNVDVPTTSSLLAVVAQPDGPAWASAADGTLYRLDGDVWTAERWSSIRVHALWRRPDGVVLGVGYRGYGMQRTLDGVWEEFNTGAGVTLRDLWGRDNDDCWAVGSDGVVAHFDGATWSVERPFGADLNLYAVTGDVDGRVAIVGGEKVHLREGGEWRELPELPNSSWAAGAGFLGGQLLAWGGGGWCRWDGAAWIEEGRLDSSLSRGVVVGDDLVLLGSGNTLLRLTDGEMATLLPALGGIADFETTPDGAVILTTQGWIMRETATGWRPEAGLSAFGSGRSIEYGRGLLRLATGDLLALGSEGLYREIEGVWEPLIEAGGTGIKAIFPLADGAPLLSFGSALYGSALHGSALYTLAGNRCVFLCAVPGEWGILVSVAGDLPADARYLFPDLLARYDGVTMQPVANRLRAEVRLLSRDPVEGLLLAGHDGLFAGDGATTQDITPRWQNGGTPERADILDFTVTPAGDWLAWTEAGHLLRRRAGLWQSLDGAVGYPLWSQGPAGAGRSIRAVGAGDIWLISSSHVCRYRDPAP